MDPGRVLLPGQESALARTASHTTLPGRSPPGQRSAGLRHTLSHVAQPPSGAASDLRHGLFTVRMRLLYGCYTRQMQQDPTRMSNATRQERREKTYREDAQHSRLQQLELRPLQRRNDQQLLDDQWDQWAPGRNGKEAHACTGNFRQAHFCSGGVCHLPVEITQSHNLPETETTDLDLSEELPTFCSAAHARAPHVQWLRAMKRPHRCRPLQQTARRDPAAAPHR